MAEALDLQKMDIDAEAANCMAQGKRHLLVHDYNSAVQCLEEACKLYDEKYGISADECADAYMNYGYALLELHRQESGALDGLVDAKQSDAEEDEEEDEEIEDEELKADDDKEASTAEAKAENGNKAEATEEDISVSPTPPAQESATSSTTTATTTNGTTSTTTEQATSSTSNGHSAPVDGPSSSTVDDKGMGTDVDPNQPSTSTGITDENRAEDEEDSAPTNIEVAFEVLTMAKNIFQRQTEYRDDAFLKLSDAMQKLGEILIEWENNEDALKELKECLDIRQRHLPEDDRLIAEAYYHIGLTHSLNSNILGANSNFQKAVDVIEHRLGRLKSSYTSEPEGEGRVRIETEIKDLEQVLPEMKSKIEDSQDQMSSSQLKTVEEADEKLEEEKIAEKKKQILAKPIMNVTHLVKRKREEPTELDSNKKLKNGSATEQQVTSSENGSNGTLKEVEMKEN